ncbi:hypothetical protein EVAR_7577_1 [Eumeta japonica]|uniref:Uncharacterized protein n=1 Tax=Eumeta variegata TaxID=151549 RepID=A0A4C1VN86_EUMVA|nr:hypothetical protein EVAR_7577_1 [Eumeta japonica]
MRRADMSSVGTPGRAPPAASGGVGRRLRCLLTCTKSHRRYDARRPSHASPRGACGAPSRRPVSQKKNDGIYHLNIAYSKFSVIRSDDSRVENERKRSKLLKTSSSVVDHHYTTPRPHPNEEPKSHCNPEQIQTRGKSGHSNRASRSIWPAMNAPIITALPPYSMNERIDTIAITGGLRPGRPGAK